MLKARSTIFLADAATVHDKLCDHMTEHCVVERAATRSTITFEYGTAEVEVLGDRLTVVAVGDDETGLSYVKMGIVYHVRAFAEPEVLDITWKGDGNGRSPAFFREMRVVRTLDVTPRMRRVVLTGDDLGRFASDGLHVRLIFPPAGRQPVWPWLGEDGCPIWPVGEDELTARIYTIRHVDLETAEVWIDILRHDGDTTPGSRFAMTAKPGDRVGMTGPSGRMPKAEQLLLLGDETALPAIARILEALPRSARARAVIEVAGPDEEQTLRSAADVSIEWLHREAPRPGAPKGLADVLDGAEGLEPDTYVWAGCEFTDFRRLRKRVRTEWKLPRDRHHLVAYWRKGAAGEEARADA
ncbi:NADPH-dependent ferric siderophore reductase [Aureimonas sp. SA4125]|uniref:siderophore-interacting protein n=1 Tax=Aureimonas sp. SA4125 TaxID=2826993 RepID=UPI001CC5D407|nr:siderophore-interacting protein [Aureimonas sp. SA4125]BDA82711.1 NADPH-dependent ferric siderophore reductase [Aureimonas sp. SA4125]